MDYLNMDERSIGMFWVVTYTMAQPACETVMNWLTSAGVIDLLPVINLQPAERIVATREVSPLPMSLISGFSMNLCLKLSYQMEDSLFSGQVLSLPLILRLVYGHDCFSLKFHGMTFRILSLRFERGLVMTISIMISFSKNLK